MRGLRSRWLLCAWALALVSVTAYGEDLQESPIPSDLMDSVISWRTSLRKIESLAESSELRIASLIDDNRSLLLDLQKSETQREEMQSELTDLRDSLRKRDLRIERLSSLSSDQEQSLREYSRTLLQSERSREQLETTWIEYSQEAEARIQHEHEKAERAETRARRHKRGWQIGIPVGIVLGMLGGMQL